MKMWEKINSLSSLSGHFFIKNHAKNHNLYGKII